MLVWPLKDRQAYLSATTSWLSGMIWHISCFEQHVSRYTETLELGFEYADILDLLGCARLIFCFHSIPAGCVCRLDMISEPYLHRHLPQKLRQLQNLIPGLPACSDCIPITYLSIAPRLGWPSCMARYKMDAECNFAMCCICPALILPFRRPTTIHNGVRCVCYNAYILLFCGITEISPSNNMRANSRL